MTQISKIRNIAVVGPQSSGKTHLIETLLFAGKAINSLSTMAARRCPLDEEPEEIERQLTLAPQVYSFTHQDHEITLIDTPGYNKFLADTRYCLYATDAALLTVNATSDIKELVRDYWTAINEFHLPRFIFVNMMDKEKADFSAALHALEKGLEIIPACLTIPLGAEHHLSGVIDLLHMKAIKFASDKSGKAHETEIPAEFVAEAKAQRERLLESIVEMDEKIMNDYLEGKEVGFDQLLPLLQKGIATQQIAPIFAGSVAMNIGVTPLLKALCDYIPSPDKRKPEWTGLKDDMKTETKRMSSTEAPFSGFIFKTSVDHFAGKVNYCRIVSGKLKLNDTVLILPTNQKPRIAHIARSIGRKFTKADEATAGQIVALEKIDYLETHQTISDLANGFYIAPIVRPEPQISLAIVAKERGAEDKIAEALTKMRQEDPNISYLVVKDTKQLVLSGMGQFHLEILKKKIERKYNVTFDLEAPRVTYKEAFKKTVEAQGKYKKQTGGHGQYGDCWIKVIPTARDTGFEFLDEVKGGAIPRNFIPSVEKGVREAMEQGFIAGYPIIDFKAAVYDGSYHDVDSSDMAFKVAGSMAFKKCMETANVVLLEPIMAVEIRVSLDYMGAIIQDLNSRRGRVLGMEALGDQQVIKALVPQAEMLTYDNTLQGITQGSGYFTMKQKAYEEAPPLVAAKVIEAYKRSKGTAEKESN